ncbi:MAG: hypothetical protein LBG66_02010 [Gallionellaceae bacterium]|jgi:hypothetical protein|nr:hypothetical protein [Gallionellaceae bacterium]
MRRDFAGWLLAGMLAFCALPAFAAEECTAKSISDTGKCGDRAFAKRVVDRELRGIPPPAPEQPDGIDANLVATMLMRTLSKGEWRPVEGGRDDWVLLAYKGEVYLDPRSGDNVYTVASSGYDNPPTQIALVRIEPGGGDAEDATPKSRVTVIATRDSLVSAEIDPPCIDPEAISGDELNSSSRSGDDYPDIKGFRWLKLSAQHRVLAATVSRSEGYAGGGGSFEGEILLDIKDGKFIPIACYAISRYQMFGGEWNPDGTRQHPESQAAWKLKIMGKGEWPTLQLVPVTSNTPSARLIWDSAAGYYKASSPKPKKQKTP